LPFLGRPIQGFLGYDFFTSYVVEIDYVRRVVTLHDPEKYNYTGSGDSIPIIVRGGYPFVRATIRTKATEGAEEALLVDLGSNDALDYHTKLLPPKTIDAFIDSVQLGKVRVAFGRVQSIKLGRFVINNAVAGFANSDLPAGIRGLIGGEILRRFKVIFDYPHQRMILEPSSYLSQRFEFDMLGAQILSDAPASKGFKVRHVFAGGPAARTGVREGDIIVAIDGQPSERYSLPQVLKIFMRKGHKLRLTVTRDGDLIQLRVRLARLI
jgi:hypothetical protein